MQKKGDENMIDKKILEHFHMMYSQGVNMMETLNKLNDVFDDQITDEYITRHLLQFSDAIIKNHQEFLNRYIQPQLPTNPNTPQADAEYEHQQTEEEKKIKNKQESLEQEYKKKIDTLENEAKTKQQEDIEEEDDVFNLDDKLQKLKSKLRKKEDD